ncbi:MAG: hypothetical protein EAS48_01650 [Chryseobacterium sp.]|nr:MAG: hypothetical protein EAS48_01650 [Chryseobacterium sp.]
MKKLFITLLFSISASAFTQVIVGDAAGTVPANQKQSVLLEFSNAKKGIILPYVRTLPTGAGLAEGTLLLDATNAQQARVMYYNGTWQDLSRGNVANVSTALSSQPTVSEDTARGTIIGAENSTANGVLVLESSTKALVLPQVNSTDEIINPAPGMMVYVNGTNKRLAVFNGSKWTYWMP